MTAGQPPGSSAATQSIAAGSVSAAVGSPVPDPVELEAEARAGPGAVALAPCDTIVGWIRSRRSARTHRNAAPLGPHSHLWPLPV